ncbi:hypothetical protein M0805_002250 [Coniferiporia weirii]|nr:hypothetical protein M0805_002250 [Coniferiporia weirii]
MSNSTFDLFKSAFKGDLVLPGDKDYEKAISRWASNAARRARIVAFVRDAEDVSLAVGFARSEGLPLAIRGGGHSSSGASSAEDGLVVDLSRYVNGVRVDPKEKLAYVGGGAIWETVDKAAIEHGLATVGGTVNHTGVGGLTLGGGYGWLTAKHGLTIDNLRQVTIVTADGSILTANADTHSDLFWAVRGSGCNFGICTEFVLQLHEQRRTVYAGALMYPGFLVGPVVDLSRAWWERAGENEGLSVIMTRGPPPGCEPCVVCFLFYNGSEAEGREAFKGFHDLKPMDRTAEVPYERLNAMQNDFALADRNRYMTGLLQTSIRAETATQILDAVVSASADPDSAASQLALMAAFEYFPINKVITVPRDATAFENRTTSQNVMVNCSWGSHETLTPEEGLMTGRAKVHAVVRLIAGFEKDAEAAETRAYGNYSSEADTTSSDRSATLFGANYPRLQALKKKYDPDVVFNKWFAITPA